MNSHEQHPLKSAHRVWIAVGVLLVAVACTAPAPVQSQRRAPAVFHFAAGDRAENIPFAHDGRHIRLRARVQGKDSLWIAFDTGASGPLFDDARMRALGLEPHGQQHMQGGGGQAMGASVDDLRIELPGFEITGLTSATLDLTTLSAQAGRPLDGVLGQPVFDRCAVAIDYVNRRLSLYDGKTYKYTGKGVILPLTFVHGLPYVTAKVTLPGRKPVQGRFVLDTGSSADLIFTSGFVERENAVASLERSVVSRAHGVGGMVENPVGRIARLELGPFTLEKPIGIFMGPGGHAAAEGAIGNIGGGILSRFNVIFDYPRKRMILEPNARFDLPFESDMSGLALNSTPPDYRVVRVANVREGSPAAEAGFKVGDVVESIDGAEAGSIGIATLKEWFRTEGRTFRLAIVRGGERLDFSLTTRRAI